MSGNFNPVALIASNLGTVLSNTYSDYFGHRKPEYASYVGGAARLALERIGNSNALYHDVNHTVMVTLCGQQIIMGRLMSEALTPEDWLHFTIGTLMHDIGYVRGICSADTKTRFVINEDGETITPPRGASDAFLTPYHIDRGKIYSRERFLKSTYIDEERICEMIEMTRFPIPQNEVHQSTTSEGALVRAADLIGQMGDPFYHRKSNALYAEFLECGVVDQLGYESPADLSDKYPDFFWNSVEPFIGPALEYLKLTTDGKLWIANLYANLFEIEHATHHIGPFPGLREQQATRG
ncbi:MAG: metal-dependent phosphohydrolase [Pseudomonadota bacterium]